MDTLSGTLKYIVNASVHKDLKIYSNWAWIPKSTYCFKFCAHPQHKMPLSGFATLTEQQSTVTSCVEEALVSSGEEEGLWNRRQSHHLMTVGAASVSWV